jgi:hypothetical protein
MSDIKAEAAPAAATTADTSPLEPIISSGTTTTTTDLDADFARTPPSTTPDTSRLEEEDTFYAGALKRTGTLYGEAKDGMLKRSGTVSEVVSGGLKRTGTLLGSAKDGLALRTAGIRETAGQGLQRTGSVLEGYRQGFWQKTEGVTESASASPTLQRTGTLLQNARQGAGEGLQRTGTILASASADAVQRANSFGAWAQDYAKGIYDPDRPFKATFQDIAGFALPRSGHSISVVNGRAYIFGGEAEEGALADNSMHIVILPSGGVLEADYKAIKPRSVTKNGEVPASRKWHTAVVVGDEIYIFGGLLSEKAKEEIAGRVWVYDTISAKWSFYDPRSDQPYPPPRMQHAVTVSELPDSVIEVPETPLVRTYLNPSLQARPTTPTPSEASGTMFVYGGADPANPDTLLNDAWAYDICHHSWFPLPPPPAPARQGASLVLIDDRHLYRVGGRTDPDHILEADSLNVAPLLRTAFSQRHSLGALLREWTTTTLSAPLLGFTVRVIHPNDSRNILLSIQPGAKTVTAVDVSAENDSGFLPTIAGTRLEIVGEEDRVKPPKQVQAVQVQYADPYGEIIRGSHVGLRTFSQAGAWACEKGSEVEEAGLVLWGGKDASGKTVGSGWFISLHQ